ncbi:MAG: helix-turn-helix domain-containing protein [Alphaproteobacteria bacterium]
MSIKAMNWAYDQFDVKPTPKLVLVTLADFSNDSGECWPRISLIARKCSLSARSVRDQTKLLEAKGKIEIVPRWRADGTQRSNLYILKIDQTANIAACDKEKKAAGGGCENSSDDPAGDSSMGAQSAAQEPPYNHQEPSIEPPTSRCVIKPFLGDVYESARAILPGYDIYHVESEWKKWASEKGEEIKNQESAFLGFCRRYGERHPL